MVLNRELFNSFRTNLNIDGVFMCDDHIFVFKKLAELSLINVVDIENIHDLFLLWLLLVHENCKK